MALNVYKVRAVIVFKKDENGFDTKEIDTISPAVNVPFVGCVDDNNEWYIIKTPIDIIENDEVIKIDLEQYEELSSKVSIDSITGWGYGGEK